MTRRRKETRFIVEEAIEYLSKRGWSVYKPLDDGSCILSSPTGKLSVFSSQAILKIYYSCIARDKVRDKILSALSNGSAPSIYELADLISEDLGSTREFVDRLSRQKKIVTFTVYDEERMRKITYIKIREEDNKE